MKKYFRIIAVLALGFTACNGEEMITKAPVYHFCLPAAMDNDSDTKEVVFDGETGVTSTFLSTDDIFVYNVTKNAWAREGNKFASLHPSALEDEGKSCTLTGNLSFYTFVSPSWAPVSIEATDTYNLYYKAKANDPKSGIALQYVGFTFDKQNGTKNTDHEDGPDIPDYGVNHYDYALAEGVTMSLSGSTLTLDGTVKFVNYGSLFRQRIVSPALTSFRSLTISSEHEILVNSYLLWNRFSGKTIDKDNHIKIMGNPTVTDANGDIYFALAFDNSELVAGDKLYFEVEGLDGNHYRGEKTIPEGGLQHGKYYYGNLDMEWTSRRAIPTVTASDASAILPTVSDGFYFGDGTTIRGSSEGFSFYMTEEGSVTLTENGTATADASGYRSIISGEDNQDLTIILGSNYTLNSEASMVETVFVDGYGNIYLKTTGGSYTLTIIVKNNSYTRLYGLHAHNYNNDSHVVSHLAADANTSVVLTTDKDNDNGTHTYVFTVTTTNP